MNLLKVAFYQGANQALVDLGISKLAAKAPPITDNPYEDAPGANVKKVLGTSLEEIDDMFARIDAASKNKKPAVAANKPAPRAVARKPEVTPAPGTGNKPSDGKLRAAFPNSPGLVDAMRLGLTAPISPRDFGTSPGASPPKAPEGPAVASKKPSDGKLRALFPNSPGLVDAMSRGLTAPISPREFSDSFSDSPKSAPSKEPRVVAGKPRVTPEIPGGGVTFMSREDFKRKNAPKERPETVFTMDDYNLGEGPNPYAGKKDSGQYVGRLRSTQGWRYDSEPNDEAFTRKMLEDAKKDPKKYPATSALSLEDARNPATWLSAAEQDILIRKAGRSAADRKRLADYRNLQKTKGQDAADDFFDETQSARVARDEARAKAKAKKPNNT